MDINNKKVFTVDGRIWINFANESFAGHGKIELIQKIKQLGSLRKAAMEMKMSYRQAWANINKMNKACNEPLVILKHGGKDGGIAQITEFGEKMIRAYQDLQIAFLNFLKEQTGKLNF